MERLKARERFEPPPRSRGPDKLNGIRALLNQLNNPEKTFQIVHVAGTNGKGTTSAMIAGLLKQSGKQCGLYTSPHLMALNERFMIDGTPITREALAEAGTLVLDAADAMASGPYLSYFDVLTAIGLLAFRQAGVDWAVLEVGLGGRSDATNVTESKALAVITAIGLDHTQVLGNDLHTIAGEKMGIVRPGVPVVIGRQPFGLEDWLAERASEMDAHPVLSVRQPLEWIPGQPEQVVWKGVATHPLSLASGRKITTAMLDCAATALCAAGVLLGEPDPDDATARLREALSLAPPGRLDYREGVLIRDSTLPPFHRVVLDGGHNAPAIHLLAEHLRRWNFRDFTAIFTMQQDKLIPEVQEALKELLGDCGRLILPPPMTPRSPTGEALEAFIQSAAGGSPPPIIRANSLRETLFLANEKAETPLVITGSFWMVGDLMRELEFRK